MLIEDAMFKKVVKFYKIYTAHECIPDVFIFSVNYWNNLKLLNYFVLEE